MNLMALVKSLQTTGLIGWVATAVFCASYLFKRPTMLRRIQALGAGLWILYGVAIGALPVIIANVIVAGAALYSAFPPSSSESASRPAAQASAPDGSDAAEAAIPFWPY